MAIKIVVANKKGGVGKTTTSVNTSAFLAENGKKVLVMDGDPQGDLTASLGISPNKYKNSLVELIGRLKEGFLVVIFTMIVFIPLSEASNISVREYKYSHGDSASAKQEDSFVVCDCSKPAPLQAEDTFRKKVISEMAIKYNAVQQEVKPDAKEDREEVKTVVAAKAEFPLFQDTPREGTAAKKAEPTKYISIECLLGTVHFDFDGDKITSEGQKQLEQIVGGLPAGSAVNLKGFTCDMGEKEYNDTLATKRAQAVEGFLKGRGVVISDVRGEGKCCYVSTKDRTLNRRVEITIGKVPEAGK